MNQLQSQKISSRIKEIKWSTSLANPFIQIKFKYPEKEGESHYTFKNEDPGHKDFDEQRRQLAESITHLLGLKNRWALVKLNFDLEDFTVKAELTCRVEGYDKPMKLKTPWLNDLVLAEVEPLFDEAAKYITGEKRQQEELFATA